MTMILASDVRWLLPVGFALALGLAAPSAAHAAEPTATERETARTLLVSGREKRKAGQLKEALADFAHAHAIMRVPTTALDLGKTQESMGLLVEARATFLEGARHPVQADEPRAFKRARADAKHHADAIAPRLATLTIAVTSGAKVKIDDAEISASSVGVPLKVNPGKHEIVATLGTEEKRKTIDIAEGTAQSAEITLAETPPSPTTTPATPTTPTTTPTPTPAKTETKTNSLVWIGLAAAGVGTAVGGATGIIALGIHGDVADRCEGGVRCPPSTYSDIDRGKTFGTISTISFIVAGVGAGILVYGLLSPTKVEQPSSSSALKRIDWLRGTF